MAQAGRSTIRKEVKFDVTWPEDLQFKQVNFRTRTDTLGRDILEIGFTGKTGKATKNRRTGVVSNNYEAVEEWFDVAGGIERDDSGKILAFLPGTGTLAKAQKVYDELVVPRVRELFSDSDEVYPEFVDEEIPDGMLAPSVKPLPLNGNPVIQSHERPAPPVVEAPAQTAPHRGGRPKKVVETTPA